MFVVKYRTCNSVKIAENVFIRVLAIQDQFIGLILDAPASVTVKLVQPEQHPSSDASQAPLPDVNLTDCIDLTEEDE